MDPLSDTDLGGTRNNPNPPLIGPNPPLSINAYIYYAPCMIDQALLSLTGFRPLANTLVDNWADWGN